jgi:hypothetical protein
MKSETTVVEFQTQRATVTTTPAAIVQAGSLKCYRGILVKSLKNNTKIVWVGHNDKVGTHGFELQPGDEVLIAIETPEHIWAVAEADTQTLALLLS